MSEVNELPVNSQTQTDSLADLRQTDAIQAAMSRLKLPEYTFKELLLKHQINDVKKTCEAQIPVLTFDDLLATFGEKDAEAAFQKVVSITAYTLGDAWTDRHQNHESRKLWEQEYYKRYPDRVSQSFIEELTQYNQLALNFMSKPVIGLDYLARYAERGGNFELAGELEKLKSELRKDIEGDNRDGEDNSYGTRTLEEKLKTVNHVNRVCLEALNLIKTPSTRMQKIYIT